MYVKRILTVILFLMILALAVTKGERPMPLNKLTPDEENIIVHKGTEPPFSGRYVNHSAAGTYHCKRCDAPLYRSDDKFASSCGWPSFDDEIPEAVKRETDADGHRVEILCVRCGGHLGHVFVGEGFTAKNTRHCVNSLSLLFKDKPQAKSVEKTYLAGGCFWGVEYHLTKIPGVLETRVGYIGGQKDNPVYKEVCGHETGHAEAVEVVFDPEKVTFEAVARVFFEIHDPTQVNGQGPDIGDQYRSEIFFTTEAQKIAAQKLIEILTQKGLKVATLLTPAPTFWVGEEYHQDYYDKKGSLPYCHARVKRF